MSLFCRLFGCRRFRTVRIYKGFSARRVACTPLRAKLRHARTYTLFSAVG
jgi:hypothetical protein